MNVEEIKAMISFGESETIEFKESFNDEALESIGVFANSKGGTIFIGVNNSSKIVGIQIGKKKHWKT